MMMADIIAETDKLLKELKQENEQLKQREETLLNEIEDFQEILTKLDKENEQLKFQLDECQNRKLFSRRQLEEENEQLKQSIVDWETSFDLLKQQLQSEHQQLENAILLERTRMGQNALKQYKEAIQ